MHGATAELHVVGVFQDATWARRGLEALVRDGFTPVTLIAIGCHPPTSRCCSATFWFTRLERSLRDVGAVSAAGPLLSTLQGADDGLSPRGLDGDGPAGRLPAARRPDLQRLLARGGVLVGRERAARG